MATEASYMANFIKPLVECYGANKLPGIRINKIWERLQAFPDHIMMQCAERIVLNYDNFPGVQAILNACSEVGGEYARQEATALKEKVNCFRCKSQGVIITNNYATRCSCQLGSLLYPAYPLYAGQVQIVAKVTSDHEGNRVYEDGNYICVTPENCKDVKRLRAIIKTSAPIEKKEIPSNSNSRRLNFNGFSRDD